MCGPRDPYPHLDFGTIKEGTTADIVLLLVDGNPLGNIDLIADQEMSLLLVCIMKEGVLCKHEFKKSVF